MSKKSDKKKSLLDDRMNTNFKDKPYNELTEDELTCLLYDRDIDINKLPRSVEGRLIRHIAISELRKWDKLHEEVVLTPAQTRNVVCVFHAPPYNDERGLPYLQIGHNGRSFYIPYNVEVTLPKYVLDGPVKDAVETQLRFSGKVNDQGRWIYDKHDVNVVNYTFVRYADEADDTNVLTPQEHRGAPVAITEHSA